MAFKDQSAYSRSLGYANPTYADAERVFNWLMENPLRSAAYPDGVQALDDFLFHSFMRMARDLDLCPDRARQYLYRPGQDGGAGVPGIGRGQGSGLRLAV